MKKIIFLLCLFYVNIQYVIAQGTIVAASTYIIGGKPIASLTPDSTMLGATHSALPTTKAIKDYVDRLYSINVHAAYSPTIYDSVTRALNSSFTISSTKEAFFCYAIQIDIVVAVGALTSSGKVAPQYSVDAGATWRGLAYV